MKQTKIIKAVAIFFIVVLGIYIGINLSMPRILRWYVNKQIGDKPILHLVPTETLSNIEKSGYLGTLQTHTFKNLKIALPKDFEFYRERKDTITFKRMDGELPSGFIMVSYQPSGFFMQWKELDNKTIEKMRGAGIANDHDFFTRLISARKENVSSLHDVVFITLKAMISPRVGNEENLKIYKYENANLKGYITANILTSEADYSCDIFDKENNYFHLIIKTKKPALSLDEVCTIGSTLKR